MVKLQFDHGILGYSRSIIAHAFIEEWNDHIRMCLRSRSWSSFTDLGGPGGWSWHTVGCQGYYFVK